MRRSGIMLLILVPLVCTAACAQETTWALGDPTPVWSSLEAFAATTWRSTHGEEAAKKSVLRDVELGHVRFIEQGTNCQVISKKGKACMISIEGIPGFWYTLCPLVGK